jgi:catechol 2,3-dioxygenase-like lactoylglutathione lyase family enzyme
VGSDESYLALYTPRHTELTQDDFAKGRPLNHVGVEVEDIDEVEARVIAQGLVPFNHGDYEPGHRFYFLDPDGTEFEVVSYR